MKKGFLQSIALILCCLFAIVNLTACNGYNRIMYEHLGDIENYDTYTVAIKGIYVRNDDGKPEEYDQTIHGEEALRGEVLLGIAPIGNFSHEYRVANGENTESMVLLEVIPENSRLLADSGFYDHFTVGETVEIQASDWIYMDGDFYYVIGLKYDGIEYLNSEEGLKNMVEMMKKNRSLF